MKNRLTDEEINLLKGSKLPWTRGDELYKTGDRWFQPRKPNLKALETEWYAKGLSGTWYCIARRYGEVHLDVKEYTEDLFHHERKYNTVDAALGRAESRD
jgi:hypothetical protein